MSSRACCNIGARFRRGGEIAGWIAPAVTLLLLPKCPACVAGYVALISGVAISISAASWLRTALLILCVATLVHLLARRLRRWLQRDAGSKRTREDPDGLRGGPGLRSTSVPASDI